jgi:4-amino-4-deoxy-L-arabinose transferase-like glycosyltransferase
MNKKTKVYVLLTLIIALGFFLRVYNINNAPPGVYPDEAVNGEDALRSISTGHYEWFYPANQGREGLFINTQALSLAIFGVNVFALKFPSIFFGTLTILGVFLLARELFKNERLALFSSFLTAVSFWAINFSRIGFRAIMLPFILSFSFYFLWKGLRTKKWTDFAIGGFIFGAGLHTYIAFRVAPAILVVVLIAFLIAWPKFLKIYWKKILVFAVFTAIAAAPMLYTFFISHPEYFASRSDSISILSPAVNQGHLIPTFLKSFGLSLAKYNFWGDQNWRHNFPPYPILDTLTGIFFLFGFLFSFWQFFKLLWQRFAKKVAVEQFPLYVFLLSWFFIMLAPEFLTAEGNPHALRSIGTLPVVFIFAGLALSFLWDRLPASTYLLRKISSSILIVMLISIGVFNAVKYHVAWAHRPETARAFEKNLMDITYYLRTLPTGEEKYVVAESMQRVPIKVFDYYLPNLQFLYPGEVPAFQPKNPMNFVVVLTDYKKEVIDNLQSRFPNLSVQEVKDETGMSYYILK